MVKSAIIFICNQFPLIKRVHLHDVATIQCNNHNLLLSHMYILCYGHTWYSKHFNAILIDKRIKEELIRINEDLRQKCTKPLFNIQADHSSTWMEFFYSKKSQCNMFLNMIKDIKDFVKVNLMYSEWFIPIKTVNSWTIGDIKISQKGGNYNWKISKGHRIE